MTYVLKASVSPAESEAFRLHQGLKWITPLGHHIVIFESDCKMLVDDVHFNKVNHSEYGLIVKSCRNLLQNFNNHEVVFTRLQANGNAHALARATLSYAPRNVFDVIPRCIVTIW